MIKGFFTLISQRNMSGQHFSLWFEFSEQFLAQTGCLMGRGSAGVRLWGMGRGSAGARLRGVGRGNDAKTALS